MHRPVADRGDNTTPVVFNVRCCPTRMTHSTFWEVWLRSRQPGGFSNAAPPRGKANQRRKQQGRQTNRHKMHKSLTNSGLIRPLQSIWLVNLNLLVFGFACCRCCSLNVHRRADIERSEACFKSGSHAGRRLTKQNNTKKWAATSSLFSLISREISVRKQEFTSTHSAS